MRVAVIFGIDYYEHADDLSGCVQDANAVKQALEFHGNGDRNFECHLFTAADEHGAVSRATLKDQITKLFSADAEAVLLYFAGHGYVESTGGYLIASDSERGDEGVSLNEILIMANKSPAKNKLVVLDSCHSGIAGLSPYSDQVATLAEGVTVLTASGMGQTAAGRSSGGVFTSLFVDALQGGAANLSGDITPGSVYAYIDQSLGGLQQRPVFKANVNRFLSLRRVKPPIALHELRQIIEHFKVPGEKFELDPSYEPELTGRPLGGPPPNPDNVKKFKVLQKYNRLNLLVPVNAENMWNAAIDSESCKLTALGKHYWRLVAQNRI